jgi:hypothetical protein
MYNMKESYCQDPQNRRKKLFKAEVKALYLYGCLRAAQGQPGMARDCWLRALVICAQLGERQYAERIEQTLAAVGTDPDPNSSSL